MFVNRLSEENRTTDGRVSSVSFSDVMENMPHADVSRRSGLGSPNNLYLALRSEYNMHINERRYFLRKEGDFDRFRL